MISNCKLKFNASNQLLTECYTTDEHGLPDMTCKNNEIEHEPYISHNLVL